MLAILHGALGDTVLAAPALDLLARAWGPLTVWGPAESRLVPLRAPRGPAAETRAFPPEALGLWSSEGPVPAVVRPFARVVAVCGPGPLADRVRALGGHAAPAPRAGEDLPAHAAAVLLERVRAATGLSLEADPVPRLVPTAADRARGRELAGAARYVVCHPGAGGRAKCWPPESFARLLALLDDPAVVALGPAELERGLDARAFPGARVLQDPPIEDLIALLAGAARYVGNDSGPTHLAAALGTPTVAVFGPTDPRVWGPAGGRVAHGDLQRISPAEVAALLAYPIASRPGFAIE